MSTVRARIKRTVGELLETVKQLPPIELHEFEERFAAWRAQDGKHDRRSLEAADEETLLACVRLNSGLPAGEQQRFDRLRHKRRAEALNEAEERQLQQQWRRVEQMNVRRLRALAELARRRGADVKTLMRELRLSENRDVF